MPSGNGLIERIASRVADLRSEKASLAARLKEVDFRLDELLAVIYDSGMIPVDPGSEPGTLIEVQRPVFSDLPSRPTDAVLKLIKYSNFGLTSREIIDQLEHVIDTTSPNKRKLLSSVISGLVKAKKIESQNGKYTIRTDIFDQPEEGNPVEDRDLR